MTQPDPVAVRGWRGRGPAGTGTHVITTDNYGMQHHTPLQVFATRSDVATGGTAPPLFTATTPGIVPASGGGTTNFLRADGTWASTGSSEASIARFTTVPAKPGFDPTLIYNAGTVLSNNNKTATPASGSPYNYNYGTPAVFTGKKYFEFVPGSTSFATFGICGSEGHWTDLLSGSPGNFGNRTPGQVAWQPGGTIVAVPFAAASAVTLATYATWTSGNTLCFAIDIDTGLMWFRVNGGNWNNNAGADPVAELLGLDVHMLFSNAGNGLLWPGCNMGNTSATSLFLLTADFTQAVPTGYTSWSGL